MAKLTDEIKERFFSLSSQLSPENLHCDGEISRSEAGRRYRKLMHEWHDLEKQVGMEITEGMVCQWVLHK